MVSVRQVIPRVEAGAPQPKGRSRKHGWTCFSPLQFAMCGAVAIITSGCSLSFPIAGFVADKGETGSIDRLAALMSKDLDQEDWRRAKAAMAVALDPQGNGASVAWANTATGAKGSFAAAAAPYPQRDQICRAFTAHVTQGTRVDRDIDGSACRQGGGDWIVADAKERKRAES